MNNDNWRGHAAIPLRELPRTGGVSVQTKEQTQMKLTGYNIKDISVAGKDSGGEAMHIVTITADFSHFPTSVGEHSIECVLRLDAEDSISTLLASARSQLPDILRQAADQIQEHAPADGRAFSA
jgi:hypothetical protein